MQLIESKFVYIHYISLFIAFSIKNALESGKVEVIQGIFNKNLNTIDDGIKYNANHLDQESSKNLLGNSLKVYN
jgi:hypothetical protein